MFVCICSSMWTRGPLMCLHWMNLVEIMRWNLSSTSFLPDMTWSIVSRYAQKWHYKWLCVIMYVFFHYQIQILIPTLFTLLSLINADKTQRTLKSSKRNGFVFCFMNVQADAKLNKERHWFYTANSFYSISYKEKQSCLKTCISLRGAVWMSSWCCHFWISGPFFIS